MLALVSGVFDDAAAAIKARPVRKKQMSIMSMCERMYQRKNAAVEQVKYDPNLAHFKSKIPRARLAILFCCGFPT